MTDFSYVQPGSTITLVRRIVNPCSEAMAFAIQLQDDPSAHDWSDMPSSAQAGHFKVAPTTGLIPAHSTREVHITYTAIALQPPPSPAMATHADGASAPAEERVDGSSELMDDAPLAALAGRATGAPIEHHHRAVRFAIEPTSAHPASTVQEETPVTFSRLVLRNATTGDVNGLVALRAVQARPLVRVFAPQSSPAGMDACGTWCS